MKINELFMDEQKLESGAKIYLEDKNGKPIDEWISILYIHSDAAQAALAREVRADFESGKATKEDRERDLIKRYSYVLVADWSFDNECTPENVQQLFRMAPDIRNRVIFQSERKRLFFPQPAESSSAGSKKKSSS